MSVRANADQSIAQPVFLTDAAAVQTGVPGNPLVVTSSGNPSGSSSLATNQVSVAASAPGTQIVAARAGRQSVVIVNGGTTDIFVGNSGVTATTGILLPGIKGAALTLDTASAVFGIVATGTQTVSFVELF